MKEVIRKILIIIMCVTLVSCGINEKDHNGQGENSSGAMGRYLEEGTGLDELIGSGGEPYLWFNEEGRLQALIYNEQFTNYELTDDGKWEQTKSEICEVINKEYPQIMGVYYIKQDEEEDSYYVYGDKRDEKGERKAFIATFTNHQLNEINIEWQSENPIILGVAVNQNGDIIVGDHRTQCMQVFSSEGKLKAELGSEFMKPIIVDDKLIAMGRNKIKVYSAETYSEEKSIDKISCEPTSDILFAGEKSAFIATSGGMFRLDKDGNLLEKIVEGALSSLSSYYSDEAVVYKNEIYMLYVDFDKAGNERSIAKKYVYHKDVPTVPDKTLTIWAAAPIFLPKEAITLYKEKYPDTYVKYETLYSNDQYYGQCKEVKLGDLEALNTQILAGEGPDVIILDGLPIESYRKQGVFADLSDCIEKSMAEENLLDNVVQSYSEDDEIYAIPLKFNMILAIGEKELLQDGFNLQKIASYQTAHPDEKVMFPQLAEWRASIMTDFQQEELFTSEGKVNSKKMTAFLQAVKSVTLPNAQYDWCAEAESALLDDMMDVEFEEVSSSDALQTMAYVLAQRSDCILTDKIEQTQNQIHCEQLMAINKNSQNQGSAQELIQIALSDEIQGNDHGLPVNLSALEEMLLYNNHNKRNDIMYFRYMYDADGEIVRDYDNYKVFDFGYQKEMQYLLERCKKANVLMPVDQTIKQIIREQSKEYFDGNMSLSEAVSRIEEKINIYASEQNDYK